MLKHVIVGNEPNLNLFWLPQFGPGGTRTLAAPGYELLLARTYDAIKAVAPSVEVVGGALAHSGIDKRGTGRDTHSPAQFILDMGKAYRASKPHEADHGRVRLPPVHGARRPAADLPALLARRR